MVLDRLSLSVEGLTCRRGRRRVFRDVNFTCRSGETIAILGPNGAGKSTLLRIVAGLVRAEAGTVRWSGSPAVAGTFEPQDMHFLGHQDGLKAAMNVRENLSFFARFYGATEGVATALTRFQTETLADLPVGILSAGQRKRVALTRLVMAHRPVWLLDEPLTSLDSSGRAAIAAAMQAHTAAGGLALVATHDPVASVRVLELPPADFPQSAPVQT